MTVVSEIVSSVAINSCRTSSRVEMHSTTVCREGKVVSLAKDFPEASRGINFLRRRTSDGISIDGFNRLVDRRGTAVVALIAIATSQR